MVVEDHFQEVVEGEEVHHPQEEVVGVEGFYLRGQEGVVVEEEVHLLQLQEVVEGEEESFRFRVVEVEVEEEGLLQGMEEVEGEEEGEVQVHRCSKRFHYCFPLIVFLSPHKMGITVNKRNG